MTMQELQIKDQWVQKLDRAIHILNQITADYQFRRDVNIDQVRKVKYLLLEIYEEINK